MTDRPPGEGVGRYRSSPAGDPGDGAGKRAEPGPAAGRLRGRGMLDALDRAADHIESGSRQLAVQHAGELLAEELRLAQQSLSEITGEFSSDDLLGRIFSSFCIGK